ncbi:DNA ligase [Streptomyces sp. NPDC002680]|uniref:ATP-dependent DNA ligase n=1 Tax=Streptomyces sp. NPDC002680 TaxID=3364659 RepID=UPI0036AEAF11
MDWPVDVALAQPVPRLPTEPGKWAYEIKVDGHRTVLWRTQEGVRLQSRTGRDVTSIWMDLAVAAMRLPPGVILDGEAVVYLSAGEGGARISFEAAQSRGLSSPRRARELAALHPATYVAFDILAHPDVGPDLRSLSYMERRQALLDTLTGIGPPIEPVWSTTDLSEAQLWYETLEGTGVEGVVAKLRTSPYRPGRASSWKKVRHAETTDAAVVGYTGPAKRPRSLVVRLPDGRVRLTRAIGTQLAAQVAAQLTLSEPGRTARLRTGEVYTAVVVDLMVEVLADTTRHAVVSVTRLR